MRKGGVTSSERSSPESIELDTNAKTVSYELSLKPKYKIKYTTFWSGVKKVPIGIPDNLMEEMYGGKYTACVPDGNVWFIKGIPEVFYEVKKEGIDGNAYERAYKNMTIASLFNPNADYVLLCSGEGAISDENSKTKKGKGKWSNFENSLKIEFDKRKLLNTYVYSQIKPFSEKQMLTIMQYHLDKKLGIKTKPITKIKKTLTSTLSEFM
tara:strand:+ start:44 stop:673 length:630 start_codon:yes stop_codon:yes gene_type:complete